MKPRVLIVGPTRHRWPLPEGVRRKFDALGEEFDFRVLARGEGGDERFRLLPSGKGFYARLPVVLRGELRTWRPDAVIAEDPRIAAIILAARAASSVKPRVVTEVHGNWRHATRFYGSRGRSALAPLVDAIDSRGIRGADAVRALSAYTAALVEEERGTPPDAVFPTYSDLSVFAQAPVRPLPDRPAALFVGVLEATKNVEGLAAAWRLAAPQVPGARLVVVGRGRQLPVVERLAADLPGRVEHVEELGPEGVARALDEATVLVLPSLTEGLGRVVIEAYARGRGVVASRVGGIPDIVEDGREGLLVEPGDARALADALVGALSDRVLAERLGRAAHERFPAVNQTAEQWARGMRAVVDAALH